MVVVPFFRLLSCEVGLDLDLDLMADHVLIFLLHKTTHAVDGNGHTI